VNVSGITRSAPQRPQRINAAAFFHQFLDACARYRTKVDEESLGRLKLDTLG
jgi:hypothetical protein